MPGSLARSKQVLSRLRFLGGECSLPPASITSAFCLERESVTRGDPLCLCNAAGEAVPAQFWPLAYWPEGHVKWMGVALAAEPRALTSDMFIVRDHGPKPHLRVRAKAADDAITIDTGVVRCVVPRRGQAVIAELHQRAGATWVQRVLPEG